MPEQSRSCHVGLRPTDKQPQANQLTEAEDLEEIVRVIGQAQSLLKGHIELSEDALKTITSIDELLSAPDLIQAIERTRLRALSKGLTQN